MVPGRGRAPVDRQSQQMTKRGPYKPRTTTRDKILSGVENVEGNCWEWQGKPNHNGYCAATFDDYVQLVHRVSYREFIGPIPDGYVVHHRCENKVCCNPCHLEPMTISEHRRLHLSLDHERQREAQSGVPSCATAPPLDSVSGLRMAHNVDRKDNETVGELLRVLNDRNEANEV